MRNHFRILIIVLVITITTYESFPFFLQDSILPSKSNQLVLISGCTGTGKSTFGMEVAISRGVLKCISTDTIRQVMRINQSHKDVRALHRSSYAGDSDPISNWRESCQILESGIDSIVDDSLKRGTSLVLEGVHIVPNNKLIEKWIANGGVALGVVLSIPNFELHKQVIFHRGLRTGKGADEQLNKFTRIRAIHDEMVNLGNESNWLIIKQNPSVDPRPIDILNDALRKKYMIQGTLSQGL